jgi:UDP-N-acetylmuramate--alanine ligase
MSNQPDVTLEQIENAHCVGIGGVGVSAIARLFKHRGVDVGGSDASMSPVVKGLREEGIGVTVGHASENVPTDADTVIHSIAVPHENPELAQARDLGIPTIAYPQAIGLISQDMHTVAVSGTHGKTTTTAMMADIFADSTLDPTVIVGSLLKDSHSNFVPGSDDLFVVEACEYKRSFHQLHPDTLIITNIDTDHLDYFEGLADVQSAFKTLVDDMTEDGAVVCNPHAGNTAPAVADTSASVIDYTKAKLKVELQVFGKHNRENAKAAVSAANHIGVDKSVATEAVSNFTGTWRRSQKKGETESGAVVYDDYGHHPTEIKSTLEGFREKLPDRTFIVVFQPHLYSRTKKLLNEFADSFAAADTVLVLPIYAAREAPDADISSEDLVKRLKQNHPNVQFVEDFSAAESALKEIADANSLILTQGAGDVYEIADTLTT